MGRGSLIPGGGGADDARSIDELAEDFVENRDVKVLKLVKTLMITGITLFVGVWLEVLDAVFGLQVWIIDQFGLFVAELVRTSFGAAASAQVVAWKTGFQASLSEPMLQPFILMGEFLLIGALVMAVRDRGVLP